MNYSKQNIENLYKFCIFVLNMIYEMLFITIALLKIYPNT
jgi:hypothetical protein